MTYNPLDPDRDPFRPPAIPTEVGCLHCGQEYESYLIEWRVETGADGTPHGFWCCPTPGCSGVGFGFDILPTDPDYQDERGGWVRDDPVDESGNGEDFEDEDDSDVEEDDEGDGHTGDEDNGIPF